MQMKPEQRNLSSLGPSSPEARLSRREALAITGSTGLFGLPVVAGIAGLFTGLSAGGGSAAATELGPQIPFSFDILKQRARAMMEQPWSPIAVRNGPILDQIDYDRFQQIKYRRDASLRLDRDNRTPVQLFHLQRSFNAPVAVHLVDGEAAREVRYSAELFETPDGHPARALPGNTGFAGFRLMNRDVQTDWLAFLGASYFRASGPYNQYGLSARGLALNIGVTEPEEFPVFTAFWLEAGTKDTAPVTIYALLDSPSVAGAFRIATDKLTDASDIHRVIHDVEFELYPRKAVARVGIAPFSSMFWYGEGSRKRAADWRPEIHDSDGLAIATGKGERIWRPLNNPRRTITSTFDDRDPKGFGLLQRDRDFVHYLDDGVFYERRPSAWVEPLDPWGEGAVHLLEIPTDDETFDNIAAYWCPKQGLEPGKPQRWRYRLSWVDEVNLPEGLAKATATLTGLGGRPGFVRPDGVRKYVIDWQGRVFEGLSRTDGVEIAVTASRGVVTNAYTHPVVAQRERWRSFFDLEVKPTAASAAGGAGVEPVDLRCYLRRNGTALTETWIGQYLPGE